MLTLLAILFQLLIVPVIIVVIILAVTRSGSRKAEGQAWRDNQRDTMWREYIASFKQAAKTKAEKRLIDTMIAGDSVEAIIGPIDTRATELPDEQSSLQAAASMTAAASYQSPQISQDAITLEEPKAPMDGTLLLLYFGAFLLVASAGLFVAFAGLSGAMRTLVVILTMAVMYGGGFWLYEKKGRLQPAGITFVAIGIAIAPLVGVAAYQYLNTGLDARAIWLLTSILCLGMYAYAFYRLRTTVLSYLFIFSFISLFESGIGVLDMSVPYYVWGLIVAGMLLRFIGIFQHDTDLRGPADASAQVLVPVSTFASLFLLPEHGAGQLSIALLLAALYYSLEAYARKVAISAYVLTAHVLYILALAIGVFAVTHSAPAVAWELLVLAVVHILLLYMVDSHSEISQNGASVGFAAVLPVIFLGWPDGTLVSLSVAVAVALGTLIALRQKRVDAFVGGAIALIALPFAIGQMVINPGFSLIEQSVASFTVVLTLLVAQYFLRTKTTDHEWHETATAMYLFASLTALIPIWLEGSWAAIAGTYIFCITLMWMARLTRNNEWWVATGVLVCVPIVLQLGRMGSPEFSAAVFLALLSNLGITLLCRAEANRWLVTLLFLLAPIGFGAGGLDFTLSTTGYAYAYLVAMLCLVLSRSIARGVLFASSKIPVMSYYRSASFSYVFGYVVAAGLATLISLASPESQLHTTVILALLLIVTLLLSFRVEKSREILVFIPWFAQALLVSALRPDGSAALGNFVIIMSSLLAVSSYMLSNEAKGFLGKAASSVHGASLLSAYVPLLLGLFYSEASLVLPGVLAVAGCLTLHHVWNQAQSDREVSGGIVVVACMWALHVLGVESLQAYTHVIAATFAGYAYWRHVRGDAGGSNSYLQAMFLVATVPLALQALGGQSGDVYGWWLILEEVGFMVLGIMINRRFLTWWGLYVAVAAVLYQLRNLGWAALSVLALFVIGIAIYRLSRVPQNHK